MKKLREEERVCFVFSGEDGVVFFFSCQLSQQRSSTIALFQRKRKFHHGVCDERDAKPKKRKKNGDASRDAGIMRTTA